MNYKYLFVDFHNGHETTYHPFISNKQISQKIATDLLLTIPGASRLGTDVYDLLRLLRENHYDVDIMNCESCGQEAHKLIKPRLDRWNVIEGISGNY